MVLADRWSLWNGEWQETKLVDDSLVLNAHPKHFDFTVLLFCWGVGLVMGSTRQRVNNSTLTLGSREMILTVSSARPTAKKRHLCSPTGTRPKAMHTTSDDISLRSVYSFSWPVCGQKWFPFLTQKRHTISTYSKECRADKVPIKNILHEVIIWYQNVTVSIMCQGNKGRENSGATSNELSWSMP